VGVTVALPSAGPAGVLAALVLPRMLGRFLEQEVAVLNDEAAAIESRCVAMEKAREAVVLALADVPDGAATDKLSNREPGFLGFAEADEFGAGGVTDRPPRA
jgi:hypothetical protein